MRRWIKITIGVVVVIGIILLISLLLASQKTLENTQVGLDYNASSKKLNTDKLYEQGRHSIGVANKFIAFETGVNSLEFKNVPTRSVDGLLIQFSVSFQYRLKISVGELVKLFYRFPWNSHEEAYILICRNVFRDVTARFTAQSFIGDRGNIQTELNTESTNALNKYGAIVENFQLLDVVFPQEFQDTISEAQNALLEIQTVENDLEKAQQEANNLVTTAKTDKTIIEIEGKATIGDIVSKGKIKSDQINQRITSKITALQNLKKSQADDGIVLTNADMYKYIWMQSIDTLSIYNTIPIKLTTPGDLRDITGDVIP